jgi:hypothetical protein
LVVFFSGWPWRAPCHRCCFGLVGVLLSCFVGFAVPCR